ncbi:hypothetical protein Pint_21417 [Pistacia integerrima]|uniref:Uncharacterized protein n=1 Tax=Pistacia integerrima TaxID=434235 RepID=A0ACC0XF25_9ROSI|nr:hypothetical protein Pint_21417 [Pistacia integerrima]
MATHLRPGNHRSPSLNKNVNSVGNHAAPSSPRTTPSDARRLSLVSSIFKSAAGPTPPGGALLAPSTIHHFYVFPLPVIVIFSISLVFAFKNELFHLCDHPILIDDGKKAFFLDKQSGKKCYMISARDLMIVWVDTPAYWRWTSLPGASLLTIYKFQEVAELRDVCWLEICGKISTCILSPGTDYTTYLVFSLCDHPILIDDGKKAFFLDKRSGKKCYMISARDLMIAWGDTPEYWTWTSLPGPRFQEVAELIDVCWLEIRGKISTCILSPGTDYTAYLVFKLTAESYGFKGLAVEVHIGLVGSESQKRSVYLDAVRGQRMQYRLGRRGGLFNRSGSLGWQASLPRQNDGHHPKERGDRWLEVELSDFYNPGVEDGVLEMRILETKRLHWKRGLVVQGIEIRPKQVE